MNRRRLLGLTVPVVLSGCAQFGEEADEVTTDQSTVEPTRTTEQATAESTREEAPTEAEQPAETEPAGTDDGDTVDEQQDTSLELTIDWSSLEQTITSESVAPFFAGGSRRLSVGGSDEVTHVGARLEYPEASAVFAQATSRDLADDEGVIRLAVPATDSANLYVAAVNEEGDQDVLLAVAGLDDIAIEANTRNAFHVEDLDWLKAEWFVEDEFTDGYEAGEFSAPKDDERFEMWYRVTYPFHTNRSDLSNDDLLININGRGYFGETVGEYRRYRVSAWNPTLGEESRTDHSFVPILDSGKFNLPGNRHRIPPAGEFSVVWE